MREITIYARDLQVGDVIHPPALATPDVETFEALSVYELLTGVIEVHVDRETHGWEVAYFRAQTELVVEREGGLWEALASEASQETT